MSFSFDRPAAPPAPPPQASPSLPCVMAFNACDPSGAGGLGADCTAMASASCHVLPVVTAALVCDTRQIHHHLPLNSEAVEEQARAALEDMTVLAIKVGFAGSAENLSTIASILSDYPDAPVIAYMPDLAWWDHMDADQYLDACAELLLPQATVLVGNHHTLCRWLLPDWPDERLPGPRDVARAAAEHGVPYTLVTGLNAPDQFLESHLASPESVLATARYERFEATFRGAGDTLSAAFCALLANGEDLQAACAEAMAYLDQALDAGFQPGMGHAVPDRLFWAHGDDEPDTDGAPPGAGLADFPLPDTPH